MTRKPDWVLAAESSAAKWFEDFGPEMRRMTAPLRPFWDEYGKAIEAGSGNPPSKRHATRLIELVVIAHRDIGSAAHLKKRRERDGSVLANAAKKIKALISARDMLVWDAGYVNDDPLQRTICESLMQRMERMREKLPSTGNFEKWKETEQARFEDGQFSVICSLPILMDELSKVGEKWSKSSPGGHVRGDKAARQRMLNDVLLHLLAVTKSRQRRLAARIANAYFPGLPGLNENKPEVALNKSQKAEIDKMEKFWRRSRGVSRQ